MERAYGPASEGWRCGSCGGWIAPGLGHTCAQPAVRPIHPTAFLPPIVAPVPPPMTTTDFGRCPKCSNPWRRVRFDKGKPGSPDTMRVWCERCEYAERKPPKDVAGDRGSARG